MSRLFVESDFERGEFYIAAYLSGDKNLLADCQAEDLHKAVAANRIFHIPYNQVTEKQRRDAKFLNFGMMFGMEAESMAKDHMHCSVWEAKTFQRLWWEGYPEFRRYVADRKLEAKQTGEIVTPFTGRKRRFILILGENSFHELNQAVNAPIQGLLSDVQKMSRIKLAPMLLEHDAHILLTVHDMIGFDINESRAQDTITAIHDTMSGVHFPGLPGIPVDINAGPNWGATVKVRRFPEHGNRWCYAKKNKELDTYEYASEIEERVAA